LRRFAEPGPTPSLLDGPRISRAPPQRVEDTRKRPMALLSTRGMQTKKGRE
jgi:hypothetical protein